MILASASPRRSAILEQLGIAFEVVTPDVEELAEGHPRDLVLENARRKAEAVPGDDVLGADTTVALDGDVLGKPADETEARSHLARLSGGTHEVWSAVCFRGEAVADVTAVTFRELGPLLTWYLATGEWEDKAGGYAIQGRGAALVERIEGDYNCVVGLPVAALLALAPDLVG